MQLGVTILDILSLGYSMTYCDDLKILGVTVTREEKDKLSNIID